jgi:hypothetical protein
MDSDDCGTVLSCVASNTGPVPKDDFLHQVLGSASSCADPRGNIIHVLLFITFTIRVLLCRLFVDALYCVSLSICA